MIARCSRLVVNPLRAVSPRSNQKGCPRSVAKTVKAASKAAPRPAPTPETTVNPPMSWTAAAANIRERPGSENLHRSRRRIRSIRANHGNRHHSDGFHRDGHRRDHGSLYGMQHLACHGISLRGSGGIIQLFGHPVREAGNKAVTIGHLNLWQGPRIDDLACLDQFVLRENIRR